MAVTVAEPYRTTRISSNDISYIEVRGHYLEYHAGEEVLRGYGKLSSAEEQLKKCNFMRINSCYLVNPRFITSVEGFTVILKDGTNLAISRAKKKSFMQDFSEWLGEGKHL